MEISATTRDFYFLKGGGEMGELTRSFDWAQTPLGPPEDWPQSLRTAISLVLSSKFPMFLWWGDDLIQFYNDAYRPSLGNNGKHPLALGQKAVDCWPEIWDIIYPLIQHVRKTGDATWSEDQLIPIYRNGKVEDVYWTFSYSAVYNEKGDVGGVLVVCAETTEKVQNVQRLQASEKRFQNLIGEAPVGIIVLLGDQLVVEVANDAYGMLVGRTSSELTGKPIFEVIPEAEEHFRPVLDSVRTTGERIIVNDQPYFVLVDGGKKEGFVNVVYQPYREDDGTINGVMVLAQDVTRQVLDRKKVEESEQRVRSLVESAPFPIGVYVGREMRIELTNQSILDAWGKGNDVVGKLYSEVLPELEDQDVYGQLDDVYTTGVPYHAKNRRVDLVVNGKLQPFYFNYSFTPLFDSNGAVYGVMNTAADVTDLNIANQKVEESGRNLRNIIMNAPAAMCIMVGPDYVVEIANNRMIELWGKTAEDILNKPLFVGLPEVVGQGFEQLLHKVYNTGEVHIAQGVPVTLPRGDKIEVVYVNFVYEAYRELDGTISGVIAVANDVTAQVIARQRIEEVVTERTAELAEANAQLQRSNAELAQFAYIASHDLQEPLRKVGTFSQMLEHHLGTVDERSKDYLERINSSIVRMTRLIRDVLAYSQLAREANVFEQVDLAQIVNDVMTDYELLIEQKNARIVCDNLPVIDAIPLQMSQLFGNLISNALKFIAKDKEPVISITAKRLSAEEIELYDLAAGGDYTAIEVADNGIGFNQVYAEQIFNIFQRLHGKADYSGTGIGLAMCKKIIENHHGFISATSAEGKGAVFQVVLPLEQIANA